MLHIDRRAGVTVARGCLPDPQERWPNGAGSFGLDESTGVDWPVPAAAGRRAHSTHMVGKVGV